MTYIKQRGKKKKHLAQFAATVTTLQCFPYEDAPACRYRRRRRRSSLSSAVMRSATESHARPEAAAASGRQISTCVPLKK